MQQATPPYRDIVQKWQQIPADYREKSLDLNLAQPLFQSLGLGINQIKCDPNLGPGSKLKPDRLIYTDLNKPPVLVVELKKRVAALATASSKQDFLDLCHAPNSLYREAVGYQDNSATSNGIRQYLDKSNPNIQRDRLASYGLVFNGDFFQLWRRVEGLVFPLTPIQRVTAESIPELMKQLEYCLNSPPKALVTAVWNRKGGVAKTTNTLNIGATLAIQGKKVLFIDLDTQNDLTRAFNLNPKNYGDYLEPCLQALQAGHLDKAKKILKKTIYSRNLSTTDKEKFCLHILPGEQSSQERVKADAANYDKGEKVRLFQKLVNTLLEDYDYIFIDVSPASDDLTIATLYCCDVMLIPSDYSKKALYHAVDLYMGDSLKIRAAKEKQRKLHVGPWNLGLVYSNCPSANSSTKLENYIQNELARKGFAGKQCKTRLTIYAQTKLAEYQHRPVVCWQKSQITQLYRDLTDEVFLNHNFIDC